DLLFAGTVRCRLTAPPRPRAREVTRSRRRPPAPAHGGQDRGQDRPGRRYEALVARERGAQLVFDHTQPTGRPPPNVASAPRPQGPAPEGEQAPGRTRRTGYLSGFSALVRRER